MIMADLDFATNPAFQVRGVPVSQKEQQVSQIQISGAIFFGCIKPEDICVSLSLSLYIYIYIYIYI